MKRIIGQYWRRRGDTAAQPLQPGMIQTSTEGITPEGRFACSRNTADGLLSPGEVEEIVHGEHTPEDGEKSEAETGAQSE